MPRGRPFEPGNHLGRGRPKGSRNKQSKNVQKLLEDHAPAVLSKGLELAEKGDTSMIKFFLQYALANRRELPIKVGPLPMGDAVQLSESSKTLMEKTTDGEISLGHASALADLMERRRQIIKTEDHEMRLRAIEKQARETTTD
jgi:hypothetical protein